MRTLYVVTVGMVGGYLTVISYLNLRVLSLILTMGGVALVCALLDSPERWRVRRRDCK